MADIFLSEDVQKLLHNKFLVVIGDSEQSTQEILPVMRGVYKDIILLLQLNEFLKEGMLRRKGEPSHCNDELIEMSELNNKKSFREVRQYQSPYHLVRFYFVTACYNSNTEMVLRDLDKEPHPNLVIMNSCLWDVSRYGPRSMKVYKENLCVLFDRLATILKPDCLFIWSTAMPISKTVRGGVLVPEIEFREDLLRLDVIEGNFYAEQAVVEAGHDVVDLHYYFRNHVHLRAPDGIHWNSKAHRRITNILFTHVCEAWSIALPGRRPDPLATYASNDDESFHIDTDPFHSDEPVKKLMEQPQCYGGPIPCSRVHYNRECAAMAPSNHHRSVTCDPSYLNNYSNLNNYSMGLLLAKNLMLLRDKQMACQQNAPRCQYLPQSGPPRHYHQGEPARYHPYRPSNNPYYR